MSNPTMLEALRDQGSAIYQCWLNGHHHTAIAMLYQVPLRRVAYVTMTATILAVHDGQQYNFTKFIEEATS